MEIYTVNLTAYPAKNGDCFLVSFGNSHKKHILIDCGYPDTINSHVKADLEKIGEKDETLEKLILTHIDADHIYGATTLLKHNNEESFIRIKEVWHNTYRHLFESDGANVETKNERVLEQIIRRGYSKPAETASGSKAISAKCNY